MYLNNTDFLKNRFLAVKKQSKAECVFRRKSPPEYDSSRHPNMTQAAT
jgi:hypothetical protein